MTIETHTGILTGIPEIDSVVGGGKRGELHVILGYTGSGKTTLALNMAYNSAYLDYPYGIPRGTVVLSLEESTDSIVKKVDRIRREFEKEHGEAGYPGIFPGLKIMDISNYLNPSRISVDTIKDELGKIQQDYNIKIDTLVVDLPDLMVNERTIGKLENLYAEFKNLAHSFNEGKGLLLILTIQPTWTAHDRALDNNSVYTNNDFGVFIESICDQAYSISKDPFKLGAPLVVSHINARRSSKFKPFELSVDWETGYIKTTKEQVQ